MRVLVVSNLYPPVVRGGYELECAEVVARLAKRNEVMVLTSTLDRDQSAPDSLVQRELDLMGSGPRGALLAPLSTLRALRTMHRTLEHFKPDVAYVWNGAELPHALFSVLAENDIPIVFRVREQWLKGLFVEDQFMRYLNPGPRGARLRGPRSRARSIVCPLCAWNLRRRWWRRSPGTRRPFDVRPVCPRRCSRCWSG